MKRTAHHRLLMTLTVFSLFFGAGNQKTAKTQ